MDEIVLGDVTVTRVMEYFGSVDLSPEVFFPESRHDSWESNQDWLVPDFYNPGSNMCVSALQTWVLRSEGKTILIDTGAGNHKDRPGTPWDRLETAFLTTWRTPVSGPTRSTLWSTPTCTTTMSVGTPCFTTANGFRPSSTPHT